MTTGRINQVTEERKKQKEESKKKILLFFLYLFSSPSKSFLSDGKKRSCHPFLFKFGI